MKFLSCFGGKPQRDALEEGLIAGDKPGCVFCGVTREKGFDIVDEDDELIVFRDRWPRAAEHLLVIPRKHVISIVPELTAKDIPLIERMEAKGRALHPGADVATGFHIPPFSSVHHLHMHVLVPPWKSLGKIQYPVRPGVDGGKKWTWFVTSSQVLSILRNGSQISLSAQAGAKL